MPSLEISDMEKVATCVTQGRGNILGLWKKFPNIAKIFITLQLKKLLSAIKGIYVVSDNFSRLRPEQLADPAHRVNCGQ